jgi:hypothetical protein
MTNLSKLYNTLINLEKNSEIILSLIKDTDENGDIVELLVSDKAKSNIYDVFVGSFNHIKIAHAKKSIVCNYFKGDDAKDDTFIYDIIIKYYNSNSTTSSTNLYSIDFSSFISIDATVRNTTTTGKITNSTDLSIDWDKLSAMNNVATFLTNYNIFYNSIKQAIAIVKQFAL